MIKSIELFHIFVDKIQKQLKLELPGKWAQAKMMPVIHEQNLQYFSHNLELKKAAVLIILYPEKDSINTIFIERTPDPGPHSGQIAFPGGRKENSDIDLLQTALREADEEIGVKLARNMVIGCLSPIEIPISGYSVLPVVAYVNFKPEVIPCPNEVNNVFFVDLIKLINSKDYKTVPARGIHIETPCYVFENQIVWGATAMVLSEFENIISKI
jgi:8-oxo-dGTP pyrophosphatase MutT (NUDIX family)